MIEQEKEIIPYHRPFSLSEWDREIIKLKIEGILKTRQYTNGIYVREMERTIKEMYEVEHCIATACCTDALQLCLSLVRKEVQVPAFNWWSDLHVLNFLKKKITWNDINLKEWLPYEVFHPETSLYLHTFGNVGISEFDDVIYDASHCFGSKFTEIGLATCISFAPTKLITAGEGGVILTNDAKFAKKLLDLRDKCSRLMEMNAILFLQLFPYLNEIKHWKNCVYKYYKTHLPGQFQEKAYDHNYNTIGFINTEKLKIPEHVETRQYYEPLERGLPNTDYVYENIICLPSWFGVDYIKIVNDIKEVNEL
ncbi:MAG: DegT/DnrJ/EryC1/StrS family aminotransferase [Candidatus Peregrinibacteria bacterium]|nr:DegT/DnrJ/EryC1/StrS family aminotransferase [Candidatus Peregrinibacteria bacterium]